jgi:hypothetical protein
MASTGSPRNKRSTTSFFRCADQRFTSAAALGALPVALRVPSAEPSATPPIFDSFCIPRSFLLTRFYPKSVSRKIGGSAPYRYLEVIAGNPVVTTAYSLAQFGAPPPDIGRVAPDYVPADRLK